MLDPLSALGVVSNVVQLVSFTAEIISETRKYVKSHSGTLPSCESIAELAERQQAAYSNIVAIEITVGPLNREEQAVKDFAENCTARGRQLVSFLEKIGSQSDPSQRKSLSSAVIKVVQSKSKRSEIERHRESLAQSQDQLNLALVALIRYVSISRVSCGSRMDTPNL
jgi:hypothetical protein